MISLGSAIRPGPSSPQACKPSFGPIISTPSERRIAIFRCVAECCHIRWFIAGAINVGASVAKYKVEELYLIYQDGRLIKNLSDVEVKTDSEIMSGMLTAINDFVQDSFNTEGDIGSIDYGNNKIVLQRGNNSYLAAVIYGEVDKFFKGKMINAVRSIEGVNTTMPTWNGDAETIYHVEHYLQPIIDETNQATREMVDNYFSEKEIVMTTKYEKVGDIIDLQISEGKEDEEILGYFEERYGTEILASPPGKGFNIIVWITPIVLIATAFTVFLSWLKFSTKEKG